VKQEDAGEALQVPDPAGRGPGEPAASLVVPVQNGEGDSLNLSAGFIQVLMSCMQTIIYMVCTKLACMVCTKLACLV